MARPSLRTEQVADQLHAAAIRLLRFMRKEDAASGIPVILRMPGVLSPGTTSDVLFIGMYLYPTLAGLVGIAADLPTNLAGKDHSAQVRGVRTGEPTFVYSGLGTPTELGLPAQLMIRDRHFKFIRYRGAKDTGGSEIRELYNMDADPWETTNLAGKNNVATMEDELMSTGDGFVHRLGSCPYPIRKVQDLPRGGSSEDPNADIED